MDPDILERFSPFCSSRFTTNDLVAQYLSLDERTDGLIEDDVLAYMVLARNKKIPRNISKLEENLEGTEVAVNVQVASIEPRREFDRKDGSQGTVVTLNIEDHTGKCRLVLWDTKLQDLVDSGEISIGTHLLVVNTRYKQGMFGPELTPGKGSLVKILQPDEVEYWDRLMARKFEARDRSDDEGILNLRELYDGMDYSTVDVKATVKSIGEVRQFTRKDGSIGHVVNIRIYDGTAEAVLTLWDQMAIESNTITIGDNIHVQNGRPKIRDGMVEIHSGYQTKLLKK